MAKLIRAAQKVFAVTAPANELEQIGSLRNGAQNFTTNPVTLQALSQYDAGWKATASSGKLIPALEDMNALDFLITRQLAYGFQEGVAEYDASTTYYQNSIVKKPTTNDLYYSLTDNNMGNALTDVTKWAILNLTALTVGALTLTSMAGNWTNAGRTVADMGILTTVDINGGTIDGSTIGGSSPVSIGYTKAFSTPVVATTAINANLGCIFYGTYSGDATVTFTNFVSGQTIMHVATASGAPRTLSFVSSGDSFIWAGGLVNNVVASGKSNIYTFLKVGTTIYVNSSRDYA